MILGGKLGQTWAFAVAAVAGTACSSGGPSGGNATHTYLAAVPGVNAFAALVATEPAGGSPAGDNALFFICGYGSPELTTLTHWMHGTVTLGQAFVLTDGTATAKGTATDARMSATLSLGGATSEVTFEADPPPAGTHAGVYTETTSDGLAALIVLAEPTGSPVAHGAFHAVNLKDRILQVTPAMPLTFGEQGIKASVVLGGETRQLLLTPAVE